MTTSSVCGVSGDKNLDEIQKKARKGSRVILVDLHDLIAFIGLAQPLLAHAARNSTQTRNFMLR